MFNQELFYSLCEKYGVELSNEIDSPMVRDMETLKKLDENEAKQILGMFKAYFSYEEKEIKTKTKFADLLFFELAEYPIAC